MKRDLRRNFLIKHKKVKSGDNFKLLEKEDSLTESSCTMKINFVCNYTIKYHQTWKMKFWVLFMEK